ncbi:hypothetical protein N7474_001055 [Penicillium riverlandense]|uniref:uncharacterized protein n=1 Tax=Penicillium riverlandense TaxID=1903569 RepID=UPI00254723B0|nr:uncharacterized protein N7474_001055 [Penicillium riverlandense]KAJ5832744.1 hypothetical protein N7474_001055 [Penicillium riverlandense]
MAPSRTFTLNFVGDVMLGRLIDQLLPQHVENREEARIVSHFIERYPSRLAKGNYTHSSPWGTTLDLLRNTDLFLINLETSATTTNEPWPQKTFNYRMHPANVAPILHAAHVDYAGLANNHTLDFGTDGLVETVWSLKRAGVAFAGAGETTDEARRPAVLHLPSRGGGGGYHAHHHTDGQSQKKNEGDDNNTAAPEYDVHVYSASDHPRDWGAIPAFHLVDYTSSTRVRLRTLLLSGGPGKHVADDDLTSSDPEHQEGHHSHRKHHLKQETRPPPPALKIFSVHWGPNYSWRPAERIRSLAHFLIDECAVDIVHGHSSHHVQGVESYHGKIIIYGCGDFVDDYAVSGEYRNDLSALWRVRVRETEKETERGQGLGLKLERLEIFPTRIERFRATLLDPGDEDHVWVRNKIAGLSEEFGTFINKDLGEEGQVVVDLEG